MANTQNKLRQEQVLLMSTVLEGLLRDRCYHRSFPSKLVDEVLESPEFYDKAFETFWHEVQNRADQLFTAGVSS